MGSFASYGGAKTVYQAPDGELVNNEVDYSIYANAITTGVDIYGVPAMKSVIADLPDTPMAQAARHEMDPNQPLPEYPTTPPSTAPVR